MEFRRTPPLDQHGLPARGWHQAGGGWVFGNPMHYMRPEQPKGENEPPRCLCCGTNQLMLIGNVCRTCIRDSRSGHNHEFVRRFNLAVQGHPQCCMSCGWDDSCQCTETKRDLYPPAV